MKTTKLILGALAAGLIIGALVAPRKGSKTRKMILKMKEEMTDTLKSSLEQVVDAVTNAKNETADAAKKVVNKTSSLVNEARHTS